MADNPIYALKDPYGDPANPQTGPSPLEMSDYDQSQTDDPTPLTEPGPLDATTRDAALKDVGGLRKSGDTDYSSAIAEQQQIANNAREALRAARMRLTNEQPDRSAMWLAVAGALGQPTQGGNSTMQGIANAAQAASPYMEREALDKRARLAGIDNLNLTLSEYGQGKNAFDPDMINTQLASAKLKQMLANQQMVAMLRHGQGSTASGATELSKEIALRDAATTPEERSLHEKKIRLLTTRDPSAAALTAQGLGAPDVQQLLWETTRLGVPLPMGYRSGPALVALLNSALKDPKNQGKTPEQIAREMAAGQQNWKAQVASLSQAGRTAGNVSFAVNELKQTIPLARAASANVPRGTFVPLSQLFQWGQKLNSNPALKDFAVKNQAVLNAYDMFAKRGGTDMQKREMLHNNLLTADSIPTYIVALKAIEQEMYAADRAGRNSMRSPYSTTPEEEAPPVDIPGGLPKTKSVNGQTWTLKMDGQGRKAYVSPDGKQFQAVQ